MSPSGEWRAEAGEVHRCERADRGPAQTQPGGHRKVDLVETADAFLHQPVRLTDEGILESVDSNARNIAAQRDRLLPKQL